MSCWEKSMKKSYDKTLVEAYLRKTGYEAAMQGLEENLFVIWYEKGEFVTSPLNNADLFQIVVEGTLRIYYIRDDGSVYSLAGAVSKGIRQRLCAGQRGPDLPRTFHLGKSGEAAEQLPVPAADLQIAHAEDRGYDQARRRTCDIEAACSDVYAIQVRKRPTGRC